MTDDIDMGAVESAPVFSFDNAGLSEPVLEAIKKMGFVEATPIQKKVIPLVFAGQDLLGQAQTGTGKTAAFGIPIAVSLSPDDPIPQALVLCPTRELAMQVSEELHELCLFSGHRVLPVYGGQRIDRQISALAKGVQVVVGTPGRILDHLSRHTIDFSGLKMLVLDEADMMLDMGFLPDIRRILRQCPTDRQTLLFSATLPEDIRRIAAEYMREPQFVSVVPETLTLDDTEQIFYEVPEDEKIDALMRLLDFQEEGASAIIFCRTKRNVDRLTRKLQSRGYDVEGLHGDLTQQQRDHIMGGFREHKFAYLVATDVASRGLDISHVTHVINFHIPQDPEAYVHRIGRTGRMGRSGVAITFVTPAEYWDLLRIQEFSMATIDQGELPSANEVDERRRAARGDDAARKRVQKADRQGPRTIEAGVSEAEAEAAVLLAPAIEAVETELTLPVKKPRAPRRPKGAEEAAAEAVPAAEDATAAEVPSEPSTEAERLARRYAHRDASKRIEWTEAEEAMRESARLEHEQLIDSAHDAAAFVSDRRGADQEVAEDEPVVTEAERRRREEVSERLREAERAIAQERSLQPATREAPAPHEEEPLLDPEEEARIMRALRLRDRLYQLVAGLDRSALDDFGAVVDRVARDSDLRTVTAALLKELSVREGEQPIPETRRPVRPADAGLSDELEDGEGGEMTRLFFSIGRQSRLNKERLQRLVRETSGIDEDDIGRIDLMQRFAFVEVRKAVASLVIEKMHETIFHGREISVAPAKPMTRSQEQPDEND